MLMLEKATGRQYDKRHNNRCYCDVHILGTARMGRSNNCFAKLLWQSIIGYPRTEHKLFYSFWI